MQDVNALARRGVRTLLVRQAFLQIAGLAGGIVLARALDPADFGLFAVVSFLVGLFALVGDFGLAPALIQRQEEANDRELQIGFTLQQLLGAATVLALWALAPWLAACYPATPAGTDWLIRALAFSILLASWRSISALQLERQMHYGRLAWIEVAETLLYLGVAIVLSLRGYGAWSLVWAVLARGCVGTALVYLAAPWPVRLAFGGREAWGILRHGLPFQLQNLVNQAGGWVTPTLVPALSGYQAVGYLTWASSNGRKPLLVVDNVMRVAFPHFSRIQHDRGQVEALLARYMTGLLLLSGLWFATLLAAGPALVGWLYTDKWLPAVPALTLYALGLGMDVIGWLVGTALNSLGQVQHTTRVALARSLGAIGCSVPLTVAMGFNGVPLGFLIASVLTIPWLFLGLGPGAAARVMGPVAWVLLPLAAGIIAGLPARALALPLPAQALVTSAAVLAAFGTVTWLAAPAWLKSFIRNARPGAGRATGGRDATVH